VADGDDGGGAGGGGADGGGGEGLGGSSPSGVEQVALGGGHTCVRTIEGEVYCWGQNGSGQLGVMTTEGFSEFPVKVKLPARASLLAAGTYHTCAVLDDGRLFCWGKNTNAQIGDGTNTNALAPVEVTITGTPIVGMSLGEQHSCAINVNDSLYCWGANGLRQAGNETADEYPLPNFVDQSVTAVATGSFHTCWVRSGQVLCVGANTDGECGQLGAVSQVFPPATPFGLDGIEATNIVSGTGRHTCLQTDDGWMCWGDNSTGQLGLGFVTDNEPPSFLPEPSSGAWNAISPGTTHTCALAGDRPFCWGDNFSGQLGIPGSSTEFPVPVGLTGVKAIDAGSVHTCGYVSPTEIWCWGTNSFGQLGNGQTSSLPNLPVQASLP
jgi:alpha-tubulin suppressor-like RCC1 family protein